MHHLRLALLAAPLFVLGCEQDPVVPPDWLTAGTPTVPGETPTTPVVELGGGVALSPILDFDGRFGLKDDLTQPCAIDTTDGYTETRCRLEAEELDLYFHGWGYNVLVDSGTCTYLGIRNYFYQAWEIGDGPPTVSYTLNTLTGTCIDGENSINCVPVCPFDYSNNPLLPGAPNCCYGTYDLTVTVISTDNQQVTTTGIPWGGGRPGDCFAGAAYESSITQIDPISGFPRRIIFDIDEGANTITPVTFVGPIDIPQSTNVQVANYLRPEDPIPLAFENDYFPPPFGSPAQPDYIIECLDDAEEILGRILVEVEEWDTVAEFQREEDTPGSSDPDVGVNGELEPNGLSPINDLWDWRDFEFNNVDWVQFSD